MRRSYYAASIDEFLTTSSEAILGSLVQGHHFALEDLQRNSWMEQIRILKEQLSIPSCLDGAVLFEYAIPRMGKRVDVVLILDDVVTLLEFKVGEETYPKHAIDQVMDYCLDLKNFHEGSHDLRVIPILVATRAPDVDNQITYSEDQIATPLLANARNLRRVLEGIDRSKQNTIEAEIWQASAYRPTPTIIEAAQALYRGHAVEEISRSDSGAINLHRTSQAIIDIIERSKRERRKAICFITGVPGAGKTLAGLHIANQRHDFREQEHAVFLSGNGPLVEVLREALARDEVRKSKSRGKQVKKQQALSKARAFIQNIHHFRDDALVQEVAPIEKVVIFDEAQRAWTRKHTASFMKQKRGISDFSMSEPHFLISVMDRHKDWAVIVCLVGGGQEINRGEAGLPEWFGALERNFGYWDIYVSDQLTDGEYSMGGPPLSLVRDERSHILGDLHLAVSVRSFRSEKQSAFVKAVLDNKPEVASSILFELRHQFPIVLTRELQVAKQWLQSKARGTERFGLVASSGASRLRPVGVNVKAKIDPKYWFLNGKDDVRSSYSLEEVATEFDIQGLELDWVGVAWDCNFVYSSKGWKYRKFVGTNWQKLTNPDAQLYLKNTYRVLLTRARQGLVIFIPEGSESDVTRPPKMYDATYNYLLSIGITSLDMFSIDTQYASGV